MSDLLGVLAGGVAVVVLLGCSAFFSSSETALFSLPADWAETVGDDQRAADLAGLLGDPHRLLVTLLVGNNVVNIAISSLITVGVASRLAAGPAVLVTTVLTSVLVLVFGEIVPKAYGLGNASDWSLAVAGPVRIIERLLSPLVSLFDGLTRWLTVLLTLDGDIETPYVE